MAEATRDDSSLWMKEILNKITDLYGSSDDGMVEALARLLVVLHKETKDYERSDEESPIWLTLQSTLRSDKLFASYTKRLIEDAKTPGNDASFHRLMAKIYAEMLSISEEEATEGDVQSFDLVQGKDLSVRQVAAMGGLAVAWENLPCCRSDILGTVKNFASLAQNQSALVAIDDVVGFVNETGGAVVAVALATIILTYEAIKNMKRWWAGEISGKRCAKNVADAFVSSLAGLGGGYGGAALGTFILPGWGTLIGGILGSVSASQAASILSDRITQAIFGLPKSEALENAYNYFGVDVRASNNEINQKYRAKCLKHHPDKGGKEEDFHDVQLNMGIIRLARGEM